jgi:hypothetical protein
MSKKLTPQQKQLIALMPLVESGKMRLTTAMRQAGYAESTALQQSSVLKDLRENSEMKKALRKHGVTEGTIAQKIKNGIKSYGPTALGYTKLGAELLDAFSAQKSITADVGIEDLFDRPKKLQIIRHQHRGKCYGEEGEHV